MNDETKTTYQTMSKEQQFGNPTKKQKDTTPSTSVNIFLLNTSKTDAFDVKSATIKPAEPGTLYDQPP